MADFTANEKAYIENFHAIGATIPPREITIFRPPIETREDLLKTILWKKVMSGYALARDASFTDPKKTLIGKWAYLYDDGSFPFWTLPSEKEFSDKLTSHINDYLPKLNISFDFPKSPTTSINDQFLRHYGASIELLLRGPPHANEHQIDEELATNWINAQKTNERKRLARRLIEKTLYISHSDLLKQIQETIEKVRSKLVPGLPVIFLTGPEGKSNYYISLLFYHFWKKAGLPVDFFKVYLDEIVEGNIIDIDEMAYSGTQTTGTLAKVYEALVNKMIKTLKKQNCEESVVKAFCESKSFFPLALFEKTLADHKVNYILVRIFCSENGEKELLKIPHGDYRNPLKFPCHLVIGKKILSPKSLFGEENADKLSVLFGSELDYPASTVYFNHKIANLPSTFLFPYAYGVVPNAVLKNQVWVSSKEERKRFENAKESLTSPTNEETVEFKPFLRYCAPGFRLMPRSRKNLLNYQPPNAAKGFGLDEPELPQEYRCPYAWYKRINYDTGTYSPLPLPNIPLPYGPSETNFMGGRQTRRNRKRRQTRKQRKTCKQRK